MGNGFIASEKLGASVSSTLKRKRKPNKDKPFVEIIWLDANSEDGWTDRDEMLAAPMVISRGWLVKKDKNAYHIAASIADAPDDFDIAQGMTIPRGMVKSFRKLKV
jgi:hypothetical protein